MSAGQGALLEGGRVDPWVAPPDADAWKDGMLVVDNQPLGEVVAMLARRGYNQGMAFDVVSTQLAQERERRTV